MLVMWFPWRSQHPHMPNNNLKCVCVSVMSLFLLQLWSSVCGEQHFDKWQQRISCYNRRCKKGFDVSECLLAAHQPQHRHVGSTPWILDLMRWLSWIHLSSFEEQHSCVQKGTWSDVALDILRARHCIHTSCQVACWFYTQSDAWGRVCNVWYWPAGIDASMFFLASPIIVGQD